MTAADVALQYKVEKGRNPEPVGFYDPTTGDLISPTDPTQIAGSADLVSGTVAIAASAAYALGDLIADNAVGANVTPIPLAAARANDKPGLIRRVQLKINDGANWVGKTVRVHFYRTLPVCANGDSAAWLTTESSYLGFVEVALDTTFSDFVKGIAAPAVGSEIVFLPSGGTKIIYALLECRSAVGAPTAAKIFTVTAEVIY